MADQIPRVNGLLLAHLEEALTRGEMNLDDIAEENQEGMRMEVYKLPGHLMEGIAELISQIPTMSTIRDPSVVNLQIHQYRMSDLYLPTHLNQGLCPTLA